MSKKSRASNESGKRIAFVISPIGEPDSPERKRADQILKHVIVPVISQFGYKTVRADNISKPGTITTQIITHVINDSLVIADLTGHNPNVFYELAIRHAAKKPVIQIIKKGEKIPFDVSIQRTIQIDHQDLDSVEDAKKELEKQVKAVEGDPSLVDSPISAAVDLEFMKQSGDPELRAIAEFRSTLQEINSRVKEIYSGLAQFEETLPGRGLSWLVYPGVRQRFSLPDYIASTKLESARELQESIRRVQEHGSREIEKKKKHSKETRKKSS